MFAICGAHLQWQAGLKGAKGGGDVKPGRCRSPTFRPPPRAEQQSPEEEPMNPRTGLVHGSEEVRNDQGHAWSEVVPHAVRFCQASRRESKRPGNAVHRFPWLNHVNVGEVEVLHEPHPRAHGLGPVVKADGSWP